MAYGQREDQPQGSRFKLGNPYAAPPKALWEEGKNWFEINLPNILQTATQLAFIPLDVVAPGAGVAAGAVVGQGVKLGTMAAQGREVGTEEALEAGVSVGTGAARGGIGAGIASYGDSLTAADEALKLQRQADSSVQGMGSDLSNRAGVDEKFFSRDYIVDADGGVINNPSHDQLQAEADRRMSTVAFSDQIGQGQNLTSQQRTADSMFGGQNARFGAPNQGTQRHLETTYPGLQVNPGQRAPATRMGPEAFPNPQYQPPVPVPMSPLGGQQTSPQSGQYLNSPRSLYDVYRESNPYLDQTNPFGFSNMPPMPGRRFQ